jgi:hypothetical protein
MDNSKFEQADLISVVKVCAHSCGAGLLLSTSKAVEELRIITGDFVTPDEEMANAISEAAIALGCTVAFDERAGADTLNTTPYVDVYGPRPIATGWLNPVDGHNC